MRTYDDSFSGQKIYPGKVRFLSPRRFVEELCATEMNDTDSTLGFGFSILQSPSVGSNRRTHFSRLAAVRSEANIRCVLG